MHFGTPGLSCGIEASHPSPMAHPLPQTINGWVAPATDNVNDRIIEKDDPRAAAKSFIPTHT
jgi:hypothetical protein